LIAPYTIAHLKLGQYLADKGHKLKDDERFQVYLTNTLEPIQAERNYLVPELSHETELAQEVKEKPILVITGNPPYSGHSRNNGPVAKASVEAYRAGIPELSKPAQGKWLQDDYVKFIRFAQTKMDAVDEGVVGIITNHSFLDNPTFRGMRASLMRSFDQIFMIDLHGNAKKKEAAPDGTKDENVFDIEQGVAISLFVKKPGLEKGVWRTDAWGKRQDKYDWAASADRNAVSWLRLKPTEPQYLFVERDNEIDARYRQLWGLPDIMSVNGDPAPGIVTTQDEFAISFTKDEAVGKVKAFLATQSEAEARSNFRLCSQDQWSYKSAKTELPSLNLTEVAEEVTYRPFDIRWTIWDKNVAVHRRERASSHLLLDNVALIFVRQISFTDNNTPLYAFAAEYPIDNRVFVSSRGVAFAQPLYLYPPRGSDKPSPALRDLYAETDPFAGKERIENIAPEFRKWIDARYGITYTPEQILGSVYAILYAPTYRERYAEFLRTDFPRIPFPARADQFDTLAALGWDLIQAHLLKSVPKRGLGTYRGKGDNVVEKPRYSPAERTVWINDANHFADVPQPVWDFTIGGYQVIDKYLKSRKGRTLTLDEIENVENIVNVLDFTIEQMGKIDTAYRIAFPPGE
jgi:predicted helicase